MKTYLKPEIEIIQELTTEYCAVKEVVSDHGVNNRVVISIEDELN